MAYHELIKDFERIRDYMRQFYVYGFKSREEYSEKSPRSYDNERRRIGSWLGNYVCFHQDSAGKNVFLSVDSRQIPHNPLYRAFEAKSFTAKDITLHFYLLDLLAHGQALPTKALMEQINDRYLSRFDVPLSLDESTLRKKLKEYQGLGLLAAEKQGREVLYRRTDREDIPLASWRDGLDFYTEADPMGVIGFFLLHRLEDHTPLFQFKHHYILHALDSDILFQLLNAIRVRRAVVVTVKNLHTGGSYRRTVCPLKIYISTQTGRQYLLGYHYQRQHMLFLRLDAIQSVTKWEPEPRFDTLLQQQAKFDRHLWGVSTGQGRSLEHLEMTIHMEDDEFFILQRLKREKRHGRIELLDAHTCRFITDVYDASEMLPWLRTFLGRITDLQCSNLTVVDTFYRDLARMNQLYGGDSHAVP